MFELMISIFLLGVLLIALEDRTGVNKAASALLMAVVLWSIVAFSADISEPFVQHLGDVSETLFFVMGSMAIVDLVDVYGGFRVITRKIRTTRKRKLLWIVSLLAFFLSAILDNLATGIVMIALLRKLIPHKPERWIYAGMIIIAANAGGSWSPVGDVTTILLWNKGNLTPVHQVGHLLLPALVSMLVPLCIVTRFFRRGADWGQLPIMREKTVAPEITYTSRMVVLVLGVGSLALVPVLYEWLHLPPFVWVLAGLAVLWVYTDLKYRRKPIDQRLSITKVLSKIDLATILFFLGILMSVAALDTSGQLLLIANFITPIFDNSLSIGFLIGVMSSFVDNVALVAATMGMYPIDPGSAAFMVNGEFWTFLAYCAVTGGSLLIIGSATGVAVMGMERIPFVYYLKRFTLVALSGYVAGAGVYLLLF